MLNKNAYPEITSPLSLAYIRRIIHDNENHAQLPAGVYISVDPIGKNIDTGEAILSGEIYSEATPGYTYSWFAMSGDLHVEVIQTIRTKLFGKFGY